MATDNPARIKLLFPNLIYAAALTNGGWRPGDLSLDALHDPVLGHVARSIDASPASSKMLITLDRPRQAGGLVALGHNFSTGASLIVQAFRDAGLTDCAYNPDRVAVEAFPRQYRTRNLPWSHPNWWSGRPTQEEIGRTTTAAIVLFDRNRTARFWTLEILDPDNPAGHVDVGKVILAPVFDPPVNYDYGANLTVLDESRVSQSLGGTRFFDKRGKRRRMSFGFGYLPEAQTFAQLFDMAAQLGITEELFVIPDPSDLRNMQRRSFCAHLKEPTPLEQVVFRQLAASYIAEELI